MFDWKGALKSYQLINHTSFTWRTHQATFPKMWLVCTWLRLYPSVGLLVCWSICPSTFHQFRKQPTISAKNPGRWVWGAKGSHHLNLQQIRGHFWSGSFFEISSSTWKGLHGVWCWSRRWRRQGFHFAKASPTGEQLVSWYGQLVPRDGSSDSRVGGIQRSQAFNVAWRILQRRAKGRGHGWNCRVTRTEIGQTDIHTRR